MSLGKVISLELKICVHIHLLACLSSWVPLVSIPKLIHIEFLLVPPSPAYNSNPTRHELKRQCHPTQVSPENSSEFLSMPILYDVVLAGINIDISIYWDIYFSYIYIYKYMMHKYVYIYIYSYVYVRMYAKIICVLWKCVYVNKNEYVHRELPHTQFESANAALWKSSLDVNCLFHNDNFSPVHWSLTQRLEDLLQERLIDLKVPFRCHNGLWQPKLLMPSTMFQSGPVTSCKSGHNSPWPGDMTYNTVTYFLLAIYRGYNSIL